MSEVKYKVWRWNHEVEDENNVSEGEEDEGSIARKDGKFGKRDEVIQFMKDIKSQGYTTLKPFFEDVGSVNYDPETNYDNLHFRASIMYYKAIPNETDIVSYMYDNGKINIEEKFREKIEGDGDDELWFIDDPETIFDNALQRLGEKLTKYLNGGYEIINNKLTRIDYRYHEDDFMQDNIIGTTFEVNLQRTPSAEKILVSIRAEQKRRAEEHQRLQEEKRRLRMEKEESNRQERVVNQATSMFSPNHKRGLELKYTNLQKAGTRSRRKRKHRKHRKTKNKKRS